MARKSKTTTPGGPYRKPRADIYTMLLLFTLIAIIVGCIALWKEVADYGDTPFSSRPAVGTSLHVAQADVAQASSLCCGPSTA